MRKHIGTALCCALAFSSGKASASETSLLDRLVDERIIGSESSRRAIPPPAPAPVAPQSAGQIDELTQQLNDALAQKYALENELAALQAAANSRPAHDASEDGSDAAGMEIAGLNKQVAELLAQNQTLAQQREEQERALADLRMARQQAGEAKEGIPGPAKRVTINGSAPKDVRISYALGAWYGDSAPQETRKLLSIGKKLDLPAFAQGFNDRVANSMQLPQDQISAEIASVDQQLDAAMLSRNEKLSKVLLAEAAKEKGAVKMPDGTVYRILKKGKPPMATAQSEILFQLEEKLGSGEVLSSGEEATSKVTDLPPAFQAAVTQLGLGGSAKFHVPAKLIYGDSGSSDIPPGAISIMTIKIVGIK
ncbi:putative FKBP-type peptidyl-prolyl cis-trans isomerase FkpA [Achromobacter agilis]|uniref:peptidylprolyl isomerase n=1 Tax=Achromobacter agilis TaxID=1353888 RepID=A0A446C8A6_9BURK|nr:putative FKBP-type peptidyl-prolyl cis-trans isomerase FkpA [Achromobacter agilis]